MKKVLILGSNGNLGSQLVKAFKKSHIVTAWDREDIDVTNRAILTEKILKLKPEIIINAAAYNAVDKCEEKKFFLLAKIINGQVPGWLADITLRLNSILVHYVSDYVFDGKKPNGYTEFDIPNPISRYGESKLMGEEEIISRSEKGLKYYLIRTSKLFGPPGKSELAKPSFFDLIQEKAKTEKELKVVHGEEISCFTYTPDLARATKELVESGRDYGIYHIVNEGPCSWYEGAMLLFQILRSDVKIIPVSGEEFPRPAKRPKYGILKNTKLPPLRSWDVALKEYLNIRKQITENR